jgi:predicted RNase H-like HicB family nuclease
VESEELLSELKELAELWVESELSELKLLTEL